ncbi:MAG: fibronectin type III-like domain-contianing protein, partial [Clostridia bacterium]|nr:fibronectin type III-like domain-contianing protein [Clostridia bacterium]
LLTAVKEAGFGKTILILHTNNALQLDFLKNNEYGIDAVLQIGGTGEKGVEVIGKLLTGKINPSGRTVNSFVYDNFSSPVMQNFGDHRYTQNGELIVVDNYGTEAPGGTLQGTTYPGTFSYLNYGESIYMDYRYYETRYEDAVLGAANVGDYRYDDTVFCSFGYGLSYTDFEWSDFSMTEPDADGNVTLSVTVKNVGSVAGKEVAEFYYQAPYTQYDKDNLVEKASVNLIEFGKTKLLKPGEAETITATVNVYDMKSYDANNAKTYIMDDGTYYLTAARNAHDAVNNILAAKGKSTSDGMTANGDAALAATYTVSQFLTLPNASNTGAAVINQLDDVVAPDAVYLTRQNWTMIEDGAIAYSTDTKTGASNTTDTLGTVKTREITEDVLKGLLLEGWAASGNPVGRDDASWPEVSFRDDLGKTEAECTLQLDDMIGADYDDPRWDELIGEISYDEAVRLHAAAGWGTIEIPAIGKGQSKSVDGPQGIVSNINTSAGFRFPPQAMTAMTWNREIARSLGDAISQEALTMGISSWWAPACNLYRSPFSGRNFEYCGVDGIYSGLIITPIIEGAMTNGVTCQIKHIVINDQEVNRFANGRLATFATEQTVRELYLKPFEIALKNSPVCSVMSTMTRIGTHLGAGHYQLNENIIRGEFGLEGPIITDAQTYGPKAGEEILAGGSSMVLTTSPTAYTAETLASKGIRYMVYQAAKDVLYMYTKNVASGITIDEGFPIYVLLLIAADAIVAIYLLYGTFEVAYAYHKANGRQIVSDRAKRTLRIVLWTIAALLIVFLVFKFITEWGPMLVFAFQTISG